MCNISKVMKRKFIEDRGRRKLFGRLKSLLCNILIFLELCPFYGRVKITLGRFFRSYYIIFVALCFLTCTLISSWHVYKTFPLSDYDREAIYRFVNHDEELPQLIKDNFIILERNTLVDKVHVIFAENLRQGDCLRRCVDDDDCKTVVIVTAAHWNNTCIHYSVTPYRMNLDLFMSSETTLYVKRGDIRDEDECIYNNYYRLSDKHITSVKDALRHCKEYENYHLAILGNGTNTLKCVTDLVLQWSEAHNQCLVPILMRFVGESFEKMYKEILEAVALQNLTEEAGYARPYQLPPRRGVFRTGYAYIKLVANKIEASLSLAPPESGLSLCQADPFNFYRLYDAVERVHTVELLDRKQAMAKFMLDGGDLIYKVY